MTIEKEKITSTTPINRYQFLAGRTALKVGNGLELVERTLGLAEEIAELHVKLGQIMLERLSGDQRLSATVGVDSEEGLVKEAGDVLWYCSQIASDLGLELSGAIRKVLERAGLQDDAWCKSFQVGHEFLMQDAQALSFYLRTGGGGAWITPEKPDGLPTGPQSRVSSSEGATEEAMSKIILHGGMVCGLVKKAYRDNGGVMDQARAGMVLMHLGFILMSLATLVTMTVKHGSNKLEHVADVNIRKLADRAARNALKGDGDNR